MDSSTKRKLILAALAIIAFIGLYYMMSPYQNCIRELPDRVQAKAHCIENTSW
jgi:hypothetical protein